MPLLFDQVKGILMSVTEETKQQLTPEAKLRKLLGQERGTGLQPQPAWLA